MKKKVLVTYQIPKEGIEELFKEFRVVYPENEKFSKKEIEKTISSFDAALSIFSEPFDRDIITQGINLKIIANYGVGYNNIDIDFATERDIVVTNTPDVVTNPAAELTLGLMLSMLRRIPELDRKMRVHGFEWGAMKNLGTTLCGKTVGIVGMGKIGQAVARRLSNFGVKILYTKTTPLSYDVEKQLNAHFVSFYQLIQESDIISIHLPLKSDTHHLFNDKLFTQIKPGALIINASRGAIIEEKSLVRAIKSGVVGGAALDVFEHEPIVSKELLQMENVVMVPHIGTATYETRVDMARVAAQNIIAFFRGEIPPNVVNNTLYH